MTEIKVSPVVPSEIEYDSAGEIGAAPRKNEPTRSARDSCPHPVVVYWQHLVPCSSSSACRLWWELEAHTFSSYPSNGKKCENIFLKKRGNSLFTPIHICLSSVIGTNIPRQCGSKFSIHTAEYLRPKAFVLQVLSKAGRLH